VPGCPGSNLAYLGATGTHRLEIIDEHELSSMEKMGLTHAVGTCPGAATPASETGGLSNSAAQPERGLGRGSRVLASALTS
jgi:hypothetical protein